MLRQSFTGFIYSTNTDGSGKAASCACALVVVGWLCIYAATTVCYAIGYRPDPVKYDKALRDVVAARCKDFAKLGVVIDPAKLQYGEEEIVDSFLNGREFYRTAWQARFPVSEKLEWLKGILGDAYENRREAWAKAIEDRKAGRILRWTSERLKGRMDELAFMPEAPVKMDGGMCRSSTAGHVARTDVRCIHCGHHTVYTDLDAVYHNRTPEEYKAIADEIREWGLDIEVDGRAACPDCCPEERDFKLSETPEVCRVKAAAAEATGRATRDWPTIPPGIDLKVVGMRKWHGKAPRSYAVQCVLPEAWVKHYGSECVVYASTNDTSSIAFHQNGDSIKYAEPRENSRGRVGWLTKIADYKCQSVDVAASRVEAVTSLRSSELEDIPPTYFVVNGRRFEVDRFTADALLALVQGYSTFATGTFSDHYPIQQALPRLRECLGILPSP